LADTGASIIKGGISETEKTDLLAHYKAPDNARPLKAPVLNEDFSKAITESVLNRDFRLASIQDQLGASVTAIGGHTYVATAGGGGAIGNIYNL